MKKCALFILCLISLVSIGQQVSYFNNIYSNNGNNTKGFSIIDDGSAYTGYGLTTNPNVYQLFYFYKYSYSGELLEFKTFYEPYHDYYAGNVGGAMKSEADGTYYFTYYLDYNGETYGRLMKMDQNLDTIWTKYYLTEHLWTMPVNSNKTSDNGYILSGSVKPEEGSFWDFLLLKTDSMGNEQWHQTFGTDWSEHGQNAIQTPDGGYLIGGYFWKPGTDHSLDAMVVKTDSLGNEQWTKYFGNPAIDDDMAFVQMADDGNYLVATVYGEEIITPDERRGRVAIMKIDTLGNLISIHKFGPNKIANHIKNFKNNNGSYIASGFYYMNDELFFKGWALNTSTEIDSIWMKGYAYFNEADDRNYLYDIIATSDNGYAAIGSANVGFTPSNMWIIKTDSMGCDTPGCATGTWVRQISPSGGGRGEVLQIWPNPAKDQVTLSLYCPPKQSTGGWKCAAGRENKGTISIYDLQGIKTKEISIQPNTETLSINLETWPSGLYFLQLTVNGKAVGSAKVVVE
ncbi:MAG: T9SS type A sorting domain-containing protein [Chlorobi bacterium]|nr:T9SS type A sorting domain-containing protein [Chlorobiota bacterium]